MKFSAGKWIIWKYDDVGAEVKNWCNNHNENIANEIWLIYDTILFRIFCLPSPVTWIFKFQKLFYLSFNY